MGMTIPASPIAPQVSLDTIERRLSETVWPSLESVCFHTFERTLNAFTRYKVGEEHFSSVTGYGHDDLGRQVTDAVFADALQAEAALVRLQFASGTHALSVALNGCLHHGHVMLSLTGHPYDTLEEVIGLRGDNPQSLVAKGVIYKETDCFATGEFSTHTVIKEKQLLASAQVLYIQRSRGYSLRPAMTIDQMERLIQAVRQVNPTAVILVDNCYGEFTDYNEPTAIGADLMAGSLIKNPGGGIVPAGGYIAGRSDLVEACASVLTCPGVGSKGGYTFELTRTLLQGLFLAPSTVKEALKGMSLAAAVFGEMNFEVTPAWQDTRSDVIQVIHLKTAKNLVQFCQQLQQVSPINSGVMPIPAVVPGYGDEVVMAGGTFIDGATLELSADGPVRPPYTVFLQGGLTYAHTRLAVQKLMDVVQ